MPRLNGILLFMPDFENKIFFFRKRLFSTQWLFRSLMPSVISAKQNLQADKGNFIRTNKGPKQETSKMFGSSEIAEMDQQPFREERLSGPP